MINCLRRKGKTAIRIIHEMTYHYTDKKYPNSFLGKYTSGLPSNVRDPKVDRIIYCFWTGENEMSDNRKRCIQSIIDNTGVEVKLVTPHNLESFILPDDLLPDCYQYLSDVHKADYLRTYFMHYYGGGYSDIKDQFNSWLPVFERFEVSDSYICGYREIGPDGVDPIEDQMVYKDLIYYWRFLIGNCSYICRPKTKFTDEWYKETKSRVLELQDDLKKHPATDPFGTNADYPVKWTHILGDVVYPLCLKYRKRVMQDQRIQPSYKNYR